MTKLINLKDVCAITTLSKSLIYVLIKDGKFPKPIRIPGTRRVAWRSSDVESVISSWAQESAGEKNSH